MMMGSRFKVSLSVASLGLLLGNLAPAAFGEDAPAELRRLLTRLPDKGVACGAVVVDLQSGETVYAQSATTPMLPASNQKILVMAAAIDMIGADGVFRTLLAARDQDLVIIGGGDPALGDERLAEARGAAPLAFLDEWARTLASAGWSSFPGDLIVDASIFDNEFVHPEWEESDLLRWYGAPVGGLNLNDNCLEVTVGPGPMPGSAATWTLFPRCSAVKVINRCRTAPPSRATVPIVARRSRSFELVLSGQVSKQSKLQSVPVLDPLLFSATAMREHLAAKGVTIAGKLRFDRVRTVTGRIPPGCVIIAETRTTLREVLGRIGIHSQNMFAEALFKRLGYEWSLQHSKLPAVGSWENGRRALVAFLDRIGCDTDSVVISDGSGLSRANRVSAADLIRVLRYMHAHPYRELFITSLAGNRTGGTLKKRMNSVDGDVYAKTGYMRGIRTLSGYVRTKDGRWYAFSVLFNGFKGSSTAYSRIHQQLCRILARTSGAPPP